MPTLVCDNYRVEHMEKHNRHIDELITKYLDKSLLGKNAPNCAVIWQKTKAISHILPK